MDRDFWVQKWAEGQIGFHRSEANPALVDHLRDLSLPPGSRVFVPLCGKTRDIAWLLAQGHRVVGVELARQAVEELFHELGTRPERSAVKKLAAKPQQQTDVELALHSAPDIQIFVGDFFSLTRGVLGPVDAVYDRAALVALPRAMRRKYAAHLNRITAGAPQLLVTFAYDQSAMDGPPFSVSPDEVAEHYGDAFEISLLSRTEFNLKGRCTARESVWRLRRKE